MKRGLNMNKTEPRTLPGFMELLPQEQILFNQIRETIKKNYEKFGFLPLDTPVIEDSNVLLAKAGGETEKQIYRFTKGENDLSLRFDLTVPLAKYASMYQNEIVNTEADLKVLDMMMKAEGLNSNNLKVDKK